MVQWNPLFKAPYNVQQSTINSRWKQVATALTLFDLRKRWRLDVACAMHTGPSWVLKGRLNESRYTFCKPAFFSSLLSCAATSNNQDKGHLNCLQVSKSWELLHKTQGVTSDFFSLSPPALLFTSSLTPVAKVPTSGVFFLLKPFCFFSLLLCWCLLFVVLLLSLVCRQFLILFEGNGGIRRMEDTSFQCQWY